MDQDGNTPWQYNPQGQQPVQDSPEEAEPAPAPAQPYSASNAVSWQAPEFIDHPHPASWYGALALLTIVLASAVFVFTKDIIATGTIVVIGAIIGASASRKPGMASYELNDSGLNINNKNYPYKSYKSFSIIREGDLSSINLFPLKRFMPPVSAYFATVDEAKITGAISDQLPYEERQMDFIDRLSRRLRF
jgi:hypothetical protein